VTGVQTCALPIFRVDVVVDAVDVRDAVGHVVEEDRLTGDDDAALHPPAFAVQGKRRERRGIEHGAVRPRVLAADRLVAIVVRRDNDAVVLDHVSDELLEALVDPLRLDALAELPSGVEKEPGDLGLPPQFLVVHASLTLVPT
jgi:hypothetical protein